MGVQLNLCVALECIVRITKTLTKGNKTRENMTLTQRIWHHHVSFVIRNIIGMLDEEMLRNGKIKANIKYS